VELEDGSIGILMNYLNKSKVLRIQQCLSLFLSEVFNISKNQNSNTGDCAIIVSS
jgi:hypothetical protein